MRVTTQMAYHSLLGQVNNNMSRYRELQEMISREQKLLSPSSDPVGISVSAGMRTQKSSVDQYLKNIQEAQEFLGATDQAMSDLNDVLAKAMEIAETGASESSDAETRQIAAEEVRQLIEEALTIANSKIRERYIFSGFKSGEQAYSDYGRILPAYARGTNGYEGTITSSGSFTGTEYKSYLIRIVAGGPTGSATYQVSEDGGLTWGAVHTVPQGETPVYDDQNSNDLGVRMSFTQGDFTEGDEFRIDVTSGQYNGDDGNINYNIGHNRRLTANLNGSETLEAAGYFNALQKLRIGLEENNTEEIAFALEDLQSAQQTLEPAMVEAGNRLNRAEMALNNLYTMQADLHENIQNVEKPDMIDALSQLTMQETALQSSTMVLGKILTSNLLNYI